MFYYRDLDALEAAEAEERALAAALDAMSDEELLVFIYLMLFELEVMETIEALLLADVVAELERLDEELEAEEQGHGFPFIGTMTFDEPEPDITDPELDYFLSLLDFGEDEPEPEFQVGDRVRSPLGEVLGCPGVSVLGLTGLVVDAEAQNNLEVSWSHGQHWYHQAEQLELVAPEPAPLDPELAYFLDLIGADEPEPEVGPSLESILAELGYTVEDLALTDEELELLGLIYGDADTESDEEYRERRYAELGVVCGEDTVCSVCLDGREQVEAEIAEMHLAEELEAELEEPRTCEFIPVQFGLLGGGIGTVAVEPVAITRIREVLANEGYEQTEPAEDFAFILALLANPSVQRALSEMEDADSIPGIRHAIVEVVEQRGLIRSELEQALTDYDYLMGIETPAKRKVREHMERLEIELNELDARYDEERERINIALTAAEEDWDAVRYRP